MKKIGLTGGIGVGKTYVAEVFEELGFPVFNADDKAKECLVKNQELINLVKKNFGDKIYKDDVLQKESLATLVFNDSVALSKLNSLVHPVVKKEFFYWCKKQEAKFIIKEAAILFESKSNVDLDSIICVSAPEEVRIKRILKRDSTTLNEIKKRMSFQISQKEKEDLSDYIIYNDEQQLILPQILQFIKQME